MRERWLDALLVQNPPNVLYLTGCQSFTPYASECAIVPLEGDVVLCEALTKVERRFFAR